MTVESIAYRCETALVIGAASGIGRATSQRLAAAGVRVFVADIAYGALIDLAAEIAASGGAAKAFEVDVCDSAAVGRLFAEVQEQSERLDFLVNSFGVLDGATFVEDLTDAQWDRMIAVNLTGVFYSCREAVRSMKAHQSGRIVNLASVAALTPTPGALHYGTSKGGVVQLTRTLAREIARHGLRANAVAPGYVKTPMLDAMDEAFKDRILHKTPLKRFADPQEIAALIAFLSTPEADYLTGQVLSPNGGLVI